MHYPDTLSPPYYFYIEINYLIMTVFIGHLKNLGDLKLDVHCVSKPAQK